jgi:hypothetical protein
MKASRYQTNLFPEARTARQEYDIPLNSTVSEADVPRLNAQHHTILDRLKKGPATNVELIQICQQFSAILHELKQVGVRWKKNRVKRENWEHTYGEWKYQPGVWEYRLVETPTNELI